MNIFPLSLLGMILHSVLALPPYLREDKCLGMTLKWPRICILRKQTLKVAFFLSLAESFIICLGLYSPEIVCLHKSQYRKFSKEKLLELTGSMRGPWRLIAPLYYTNLSQISQGFSLSHYAKGSKGEKFTSVHG